MHQDGKISYCERGNTFQFYTIVSLSFQVKFKWDCFWEPGKIILISPIFFMRLFFMTLFKIVESLTIFAPS